MSTELAKTDAKPKVMEIAVGSRGVQLRTYEDAWRFSQAVIQSDLAPSSFKTAQQVLVAIQYGAEVGFPPMQALQSIAVINGRACLWGDALPALVRNSGECEYIKEWIEGDGDKRTAHCETKRKGESEPCHKTFSVADAKAAGLWMKKSPSGKPTPWVHYPDRMLAMRARSWALRDTFADAMRGLQIREEVEDYADSSIPGEVIQSTPPRLLSEIPDSESAPLTPQPSASFIALRDAIERGDTEGIGEDIASALSTEDITEDEASELRGLLA